MRIIFWNLFTEDLLLEAVALWKLHAARSLSHDLVLIIQMLDTSSTIMPLCSANQNRRPDFTDLMVATSRSLVKGVPYCMW